MINKLELYKNIEEIANKCTCEAKHNLINLKNSILTQNLSTTDKNRHNMYYIYDDVLKQIYNLSPALKYITKINFTYPVCTIHFKDDSSIQFKYVSRKSKEGVEISKKYSIIDLNCYEKEN